MQRNLVRGYFQCSGFVVLIGLLSGCDRTGDGLAQDASEGSNRAQFVSATASPRTTLDQCIHAYQQLKSYEDEAFVQLRYELDGKLLEDRAPLSVGWNNQGQVGIQAYSVQAGPGVGADQGRWRLRFRDDDELVPHQVLSRSLPKKVDFTWLLSDPLVAERLSAGLAGFPPQLDLLLSANPLSGLIDDSAALTYLPPESIGDRVCFVIKVQRAQAEYVLYIDQASLLLRRMRMPRTHLTQQMLADQRVRKMELTIEFVGVRAGGNVDWQRFAIDVQSEDLLVNRFVPVPPAVDTRSLGKKMPAIHLEAPSGESVYISSKPQPQRKATVLIWLADHPTCRVAVEQLRRVATALVDLNVPQGAVEFVPVWAEPQPPAGSTFESIADDWKLPGKLALDREALGRDLFYVLEAPTLVVIDAENRLQLRESRSNPLLDQLLPTLLARLVDGEDLAQEIISQQQHVQERYEAELRMSAATDADRSKLFPAAQPYPPQSFTLRELARERLPVDASAVTCDKLGTLWTWLTNGELLLQPSSASGHAPLKHKPRWPINTSPAARLEVAPTNEDIALCKVGGNEVHLFNTRSEQSRTVHLGTSASVVDMQWFSVSATSAARLAVITRDGQTVLIDPTNREQLSGRSPLEPKALLSLRHPTLTTDGHVVLADGAIEPLQLSTDTSGSNANGLGHPVVKTVATGAGQAATNRPTRVAFQPDVGPWLTCRNGGQELTLARGWLAADEPALFLLDQGLNQRWHYRMPLQSTPALTSMCAAQDPRSGQAVWGLSSGDNTIHLLRADGQVIDHFRPNDPVVGLALAANGVRLELTVVHSRESIRYAVDWN